MTLPVKMTKGIGVLEYWSIGVLECWSVGKSLIPILSLNKFLNHSIIPPLHYSKRLPHEVKTIEAPSGGGMKPPRIRNLYSPAKRLAGKEGINPRWWASSNSLLIARLPSSPSSRE